MCSWTRRRVERFVTLDALDQEVWCRTDDVARALVDLLPALACRHRVRARASRAVIPTTTASTSPHSWRAARSGPAPRLALLRAVRARRPRNTRLRMAPPRLVPAGHESPVHARGDRAEVGGAARLRDPGARRIRRTELARRTGERAVRADPATRRTVPAPPLVLRRGLPLRRAGHRPGHRGPGVARCSRERVMAA